MPRRLLGDGLTTVAVKKGLGRVSARHLRRATAVLFWFPPETLCPIALFELGGRVTVPHQPLFVGTDPRYARRADVEIQLRLARPEIRVATDIHALVRQVEEWLANRSTS